MKILRRVLGTLLAIVLVSAALFVALRPRVVADWWALRNYEPSPRVAQIADLTAMTPEARTIFYIYDPKIEESEVFNTHCTIREASIVLGCYNGTSIYVFNVSDPRLAGVQEVTAAHEMLHAAYDRLSDEERERIDGLTNKQFIKLGDERIVTTIKAYRARDESVVPNELHSILATEVPNLDPELETYYAQYFTDRSKVVALSESYEQVFTDIKNKVERQDAELTLLKADIDSREKQLASRAVSITAEKSQLDQLSASNKAREYNARVPAYNRSVEQYNADLAQYRNLIAEYNQKVIVRNETTVEQNNLIDSLSSKASDL